MVSIPDANLWAKIGAVLDKDIGAPTTVAEMKTLTRLEAGDSGISDLTGLEYATNLETLWRGDNNIMDISALSTSRTFYQRCKRKRVLQALSRMT